jgi:acetyltransferase-like isoleucine patch superfamily enzyme
MRCNIVSGREGIEIGKNVIIGAGSLVNKSIPKDSIAYGVPIVIKN